MRHIQTYKLFENDEWLYTEIGYDEWSKEKDIEMSERDEEELDRICYKYNLTRSSWGGISLDYEDRNDEWDYYQISKTDDEWFLVSCSRESWYKCDSFVGVEELFKDIRSDRQIMSE